MRSKNKIYDLAIKHYGSKAQIYKAVEELNELAVALMHFSFNKSSNILEEIADVEIMLEQLRIMFRSNKKTIDMFKINKLKSLDKKLEEEK